jgi:hypothetical protein
LVTVVTLGRKQFYGYTASPKLESFHKYRCTLSPLARAGRGRISEFIAAEGRCDCFIEVTRSLCETSGMTISNKLRATFRTLLAGPLTVIVACVAVAAMPLWLPPGPAKVDHLIFPLILFPAIWALVFFYALLDRKLWRVTLLLLALGLTNGGMLVQHLSKTPAHKVSGAVSQ